jgi:DnaJ-class molecular chaperone
MRDPYTVLGVSKNASEDDIKSAYRTLAKKFHPDLNPGKKEIELKFKEINAAYDILSDTGKRTKFDRGGTDAQGNERQQRSYRTYRSSTAAPERESSFSDFVAEDIFADLFGGVRAQGTRFHSNNWGQGADPFAGAREKAKGADTQEQVTVSFAEAAFGGKKRVKLQSGKTLEISIPPGTESGRKLRLKGQGYAGLQESRAGDAIIEITVQPHPFFTAKGSDIYLDLPVALYEAVLGATVQCPTLEGPVEIKIPKGANTGTTLRLRGKGIPDPQGVRGDQYVKLKIMLPDQPDEHLNRFAEKWAKDHGYDPRKKAGLL